ncbi:MAG TPA: putative DNA modification/repair radical SAM protein [Rhizomicrobium sp.]|jgi:putative DNA modification/repair radical SAM protein
MRLDLVQKLEILADAAKYDASCASSGGTKRKARGNEIGSVTGAGICHSFTPDGRCVSLLKILLTNFCIYDCAYCVSRRSSNVRRARFSVEDVVTLTLDFYRRNCIEGLFLSSGIARSEDDTMQDLVRVAKTLREEHGFRGYIHLKTIPGADPELIAQAGLYADRVSMNVELPSERSLAAFAPEKSPLTIKRGMAQTRGLIEAAAPARKRARGVIGKAPSPHFAPAGQSTQLIVGADGASDADIISNSANLYASYALKRVYYSAFSPTGHPSGKLPHVATPLLREHRLYQSDWLWRFYGFSVEEVMEAMPGGMLDLAIDPKLAWALKHREQFPVDVNAADRELLLRVPGLGTRAVDKIIGSRRSGQLRFADIARLTKGLRRAREFLATDDWHPRHVDDARLASRMSPAPQQMTLF